MTSRTPRLGLIALSIAFVLIGLLFVRRVGIETDEAMLANGIYDHGAPWYSWKFGGYEVPVMLITYLGALKTWLFNPYFAIWRPSPLSLRFPALLAGAGTLCLFFAFVDRTVGRIAAWMATLLLATDSAFLLVEATDFGFVALQFLMKLSAILLLLRFHRTGSPWTLAGGFFLFGLALWDKAVFAWVLFGLAAAAVVIFPREVWRHLTLRNLAIAAASMTFGALPLVIYNIARPLETIRANAKVAREPLSVKADHLIRTLDGYELFGFVTASDPGPHPGSPRRMFQSAAVRLASWRGGWRRNLTLPALAAAIVTMLAVRRARKPILFGLAACAATWLAMALTDGGGGAVQHIILLWPFPAFVIGTALAQAPRLWAAGATTLLCLSNLAVTDQYYAELIRNGPAIRFTDAIEPLNQYLRDSHAERIFMADWGFIHTLSLLTEGSLPVYNVDARDSGVLSSIVAGSTHLFVSHTPEYAFVPETRKRLDDQAHKDGLEEEPVATISDHNGRPTFEVFRFRRVALTSRTKEGGLEPAWDSSPVSGKRR